MPIREATPPPVSVFLVLKFKGSSFTPWPPYFLPPYPSSSMIPSPHGPILCPVTQSPPSLSSLLLAQAAGVCFGPSSRIDLTI